MTVTDEEARRIIERFDGLNDDDEAAIIELAKEALWARPVIAATRSDCGFHVDSCLCERCTALRAYDEATP